MADYFSDVGYDELRVELGVALPAGVGVPVMIVEADYKNEFSRPAYAPDATHVEFRDKKITVGEGGPRVYAPYSAHATGVGRRFFGARSSVSPGIDRIASYRSADWFGPAFLRLGELRQPKESSSRVACHAWVGNTGPGKAADSPRNSEALRRIDWLVETDQFVHVVGFNAGDEAPLLADAFNVVSVSETGATRHRNTLALDKVYIPGRTRPHLVVPEKTPSTATGRVASVVAMLAGVGHADASLSHGVTENRRGDKIYNAERSEVIKAVLMAGADRVTDNASGANIVGYRAAGGDRRPNGLDRRYGAGQLNIKNSYRILVAGEQDSTEDDASDGTIGPAGFDLKASFGGVGDGNRRATYRFSTGRVGGQLTVSLVWNIDIDGGSSLVFDSTATLHDLDMVLYDVAGDDPTVVAESRSFRDNSENIHIQLAANRDYEIHILAGAGQPPFDWAYGLAWRFVQAGGV